MRRSGGNDSGSTKAPYRNATPLSAAAAQNGARGDHSPSTPPSSGPATKQAPNAAPNRPKPRSRCSGSVMSAPYDQVGAKPTTVTQTLKPTTASQHKQPDNRRVRTQQDCQDKFTRQH